MEELEAVSQDKGIAVSEGLSDRIRRSMAGHKRKKITFRIAGAAAAAAVIDDLHIYTAGKDKIVEKLIVSAAE